VGIPICATLLEPTGISGKYEPAVLLKLIATEKVTFFTLRSHHPSHACQQSGRKAIRSFPMEGHHRWIGAPKAFASCIVSGINLTTAYACPDLSAFKLLPT